MSEENQSIDQGNQVEAPRTLITQAEKERAENSPMLSKSNAPAEGVPPTPEPEVKLPESQPAQPAAEVATPESKIKDQAANIDVVGMFSDDPQYKPIAQYLDLQLKDIDTTRAFGKAIEYGNMDLVDKAYLTEKLGDRAEQVIALSSSLFEAASAKAQAEVQSVYTQFGGKETVDQAVKFFNEKGDPNVRKVLGSLLSSGVKENIAYAMEQIVGFSKSAGGVVQKSAAIPLGQPSAQVGLSAAEYQAKIRELGPKAKDADLDRLAQARKLGVQQGL